MIAPPFTFAMFELTSISEFEISMLEAMTQIAPPLEAVFLVISDLCFCSGSS